jgi:hypothetical protein
MLKSAVTVCSLLCLIACNRLDERRTPANNSALSVSQANPKYASMAVDAVARLRESFNSGNCGLIYRAASEPFRERESQEAWLKTCERLRADLGSWMDFSVRSTRTWQSFTVLVDGAASFSTGSYNLRTTWLLQNGRANLFSLYLQGAGRELVVPESPIGRQPRLTDPPPSPGRVGEGADVGKQGKQGKRDEETPSGKTGRQDWSA